MDLFWVQISRAMTPLAAHNALFRGVLKGSTLCAEIGRIELLACNAAVMHTMGTGRKRSYQTYVLKKIGKEWLTHSFQNTKVQAFSVWVTRLLQGRPPRRSS